MAPWGCGQPDTIQSCLRDALLYTGDQASPRNGQAEDWFKTIFAYFPTCPGPALITVWPDQRIRPIAI